MLAPIDWLKEFVSVPADLHAFCSAMTLSGSKVESLHRVGEGITHVVTGRILKIEKHPDADKLVVCQIDMGEGPVQIVTGAKNVREGQIVPVAQVGAHLPGDIVIKAGKLRGVESNGMLCSIAELGLTHELFPDAARDGIFILPEDLEIGQDVFKALDLDGATVEFEITSNRPDCYSIEGLAREAAITQRLPFAIHEPVLKAEGHAAPPRVQIESEDCLRYCARRVEDVKIEPSPLWLRRRLENAGVRPINTIVDITNYVMLELGQPMHAFSFVRGDLVRVRHAEPGEKLKTLDDQDHDLTPEMLVIADAEGAIGLAGVMGGANSQIVDGSTSIVFESANFDANSVRRTAAKLGIRTESSSRFERVLDPNQCLRALNRACELVEQLGCGRVSSEWIDVYPKPYEAKPIAFDPDRCNRFLGLELSHDEIAATLEATECKVDRETWTVTPPTFRPDLEGFADLAEEVARFHDYNNIPATLLPIAETTVGGRSRAHEKKRVIKEIFRSLGFYEAYTYSFMSPKELDRLGLPEDSTLRRMIRIRRAPEDMSGLRTTPLPALLQILRNNSSRAIPTARLFEILRCYHPQDEALPQEREVLAAGLYDLANKDAGERFYELKHAVEEIGEQLGIRSLRLHDPAESGFYKEPAEYGCFHPNRTAWISVRNEICGLVGYLHPGVASTYEVPKNTAVLLLDVKPLVEASVDKRSQKPLPKFPATTRDLALVTDLSMPVGKLSAVITKQGGKLLESVALFDIFQGGSLGADKKSAAFRLTFRSATGTLTDAEVQPVVDAIIKGLEKLGAELRK